MIKWLAIISYCEVAEDEDGSRCFVRIFARYLRKLKFCFCVDKISVDSRIDQLHFLQNVLNSPRKTLQLN